MLDLRKLRYFATVAELGSFTKAASVLHVAQPALSRQVRQLEEEVGLELLLRTKRQLRLTDAGEAMLRHARTIDRDFERLIEDMQARKSMPQGRVVFGIPPTLADITVPALVERVTRDFPMISLQIVEGVTPVLADWIRSNKADLAILSLAIAGDAMGSPGLTMEALASEDMVVAEKACWSQVPLYYELEALKAKPLVVSEMLAEIARRQLGEPSSALRFKLEIDSVQALKTMVVNGQAATILPISMLREELKNGTVAASAITSLGVRRQLVLAQPSFRQMTQATETLRRVVKEQFAQMSAEGAFSLDALSSVLRVHAA